jgi:hypothetical protein
MTQIIILAEPQAVFVAADMLLTNPDGSVHREDATKMVLFEGRLLLAYTGLARVGATDTGAWLANALRDYRLGSEALPGIAEKLNRRWRSLRVVDDRLTISGIGAAYFDGDPRTYFAEVSNAYAGLPTHEFRWRVSEIEPNRRAVMVVGQPLAEEPEEDRRRTNRLLRTLRTLSVRQVGAQERGRILALTIRDTATSNRLVGADVLVGASSIENMLAARGMVLSRGDLRHTTVSTFIPAEKPQYRHWKTMWLVSGGTTLIGGGGEIPPGARDPFAFLQ